MDAETWIARFAAELGLEPPTAEQRDAILELARVAAHASERRAAPIACWLAATAGRSPEEAAAIARDLEVSSDPAGPDPAAG
jgi:transcription initiation factor TFIIIB Brf1 subunit/transcription initiation factor TFIIB